MNPQIIEHYELLVVGIETTTTAATFAADMRSQGELADQLELESKIKHRVDPDAYLVLLWNWSSDGEFPLMTAVEVTSDEGQPGECVVQRLPACDFAVFSMSGLVPDLAEPWPEILAWYPLDLEGLRTTIRRYYQATGNGEILIPMVPHLQPKRS